MPASSRKHRAPSSSRFSSLKSTRPPRNRARTRSSRRPVRSWPTPIVCSASVRRPTRALRRRRGGAAGTGRRGSASSSWRRWTPGSRPTSSTRRHQVAARRPGVLPAFVFGGHRRLAGAPAGDRGPACRSRAPEEEARPGAGRRHRKSRHAAPGAARLRARDRACRRARCRAGADPRAVLAHRRRSVDAAAGGGDGVRAGDREGARGPRDGQARVAKCASRTRPGKGSGRSAGLDAAEFYFSPNPGEDLRPLARIASGGELSRVMLALQTLASTDAPGKTLIFDEVDAGIGGAAADAVGARLQPLGDRFQVLCITHLPQIAAYGGHALSHREDGPERPHVNGRRPGRRHRSRERDRRG